jgi:hypothetical protein
MSELEKRGAHFEEMDVTDEASMMTVSNPSSATKGLATF